MSDHPDFDALSAYLDADGDPGVGDDVGDGVGDNVEGHVRGCAACRERVEALRAVRDAVGQPVPSASDAARERAIAAALAAADEWMPAPAAPAPAAGIAAAPVRSPSPSSAPASSSSPAGQGRFRWWMGGSAVAAVLVLVVGTMALLNHDSHQSTGTALSAGPPAAESAGDSAAAAKGAPGAGGAAVTGDLGDVADVNVLRSRVAGSANPLAPAQAVAGDATSRTNSGASAVATGNAGAVPVPSQVGTRVCEEQIRTARPELGIVTYAATLRYAGTPAVVLGFQAKGVPPPTQLLVLAPGQGCRVLAETTLP